MKLNAKRTILSLSAILLLALAGYWGLSHYSNILPSEYSGETSLEKQWESYAGEEEYKSEAEHEAEEREERLERIKSKKERGEYYFRLLRDPATNEIPPNIRAREINHAKQIPTFEQVKRNVRSKGNTISVAEGYNWQLAGPPAVGGRTRALAIDQTNSDVIIAGGVSGGVWKSTDGGDTWNLKTGELENFSVSSIAQDPTNPTTWYYTSGEYTGSSADAPGASYYGTGIFKSTNNGESWTKIPGTNDENAQFDSPYDFINRVEVSSTSGTVFTANNAFGIYRSPDGNDFTDLTLGGRGEHAYADVDVASDGTVVAVLSSVSAGISGGNPGVYASTDDGQSWTDITPSTFPADHGRSVITTAPSDPDLIYVLTQKTQDDSNQGVSFHMIDISNGVNNPTSEDRSANLPDFGDPVGGFSLQGGYNMTVTVKPNDPLFVTLGGTNLFRSYDGFATAPSGNTEAEKDKFWIGGYDQDNDVSQYADQHADQHVQVYDPSDPDRLWVGHDGGLSVTNDITAEPVDWIDRNDGYIVTQFYDVSIGLGQDDPRIMGGTQDNGTPLFELNNQQLGTTSQDISSGDGGYSFFTENFLYVSTQRQASTGSNRVVRISRDNSTAPTNVTPLQATTAFFINPYAVDPNDEGIMYYPAGDSLFRNTNVDQGTQTEQNWELMSAAELSNHNISALAVSTSPSNILYYAGSNNSGAPVVKRLDNASVSNSEPVDISIPQAEAGAFIHDIAINPLNANDVLVVMSNYGIVGLYHTSDGGSSWEAVEGNLAGSGDRSSSDAGPSMRTATIVPSESGPIYVLGTSTGLYATQTLNGDQTQWGRESAADADGNPDIGFSVVENITSRLSDGDIAVGTHGRGIFVGDFQGQVTASDFPLISLNPTEGQAGDEVTITATNFQFSSNPEDNNVLFGPIPAEVTQVTSNQLTAIVPRGTLPPMSENQTIFVSVDNTSGANPQDVPFKILDPNTFTIKQNYPNPFTASTTIPFDLPADAEVTISVYNMSGQQVLQPLKQASYNAGTYNEQVDLSQLASGIYIYRVYVKANSGGDDAMQSKKMTLIK